ncbi:hypothetical protein ACQEU5_22130 [Marinactinospora thermotolerans]|uniref:Lsr2 protein n=1 Tax=Marinactinospora thermotolerans DSM 45154 TaxID=1122192 RepID=A0A1T4P4E8_9ACTN|nr:hypothetical protein [Marinactinospora thermotolerans]SJZ86126.1 hypothetical protein SAMN02745673_01618 [Marinactinospora thermotolerans DSM 45154]
MVTEVFTRTYCDVHDVQGERVDADGNIQFAWEYAIREIDACQECIEEYNTRFEPLFDRSRVAKKPRAPKSAG